jgi:hypothetical protein
MRKGGAAMDDEKLDQVLPLMFRHVPVNELARTRLKQRLFGGTALSDDDLSSLAAAGDPNEQDNKEKEIRDECGHSGRINR